jgi:hypothetical protein
MAHVIAIDYANLSIVYGFDRTCVWETLFSIYIRFPRVSAKH